MNAERLARYHAYTRKHSVNWPLYLLARVFMTPFFLVYFRYVRTGREYARVKGGLIVAANHRSFLDPFAIGGCLPWRRPMNYVAKVELFERRWQGWILSRLGAFPIRRGESDEESMETARLIVERGGAVCIFPEGTRIRRGTLGNPRRGVGRLALQTGAPVIPAAVLGTENVRRGWRIRPRKVKVRLGRAMTFPRAEEPSQALAETVTARIWPNVQLQWEDLGGLPPMRRAAVIGAGSWGTAVAVLLARGGLEVQLGARNAERAAEMIEAGENRRYLPGVPLPETIDVRPASEIELAGLDLICLAIPSKSLPQAVGAIADRVGGRSSVLLLTKGLIAPQGQLPAEYVGERVRARAIACLGGPAHAREAVSGSAALVLGSADVDLRVQLGEVFDRAGLVCERSGDVTGVEMAGAAKNAAALAAAAAEPHGLNAAGIAVAEIWQRVHRVRDRARGGAGDLLRPGRGRRPDRDDDGPGRAQPPRRRAARHRHPGGGDPGHDRPGLRGARHDAAAGRGRRRLRRAGRGAERPRRPDPRRDRRRGLGRRAAPGRAIEAGGLMGGSVI